MPKTRRVEYWRMWAGSEGDRGEWDTDYIEVPADTPEEKLNNAIYEAAKQIEWSTEPPILVGFYSSSNDDEDEESERP
jgi:hypothetical protein